jgi:thiamine biosynthesis lipoprotein
MPRTKILSKTFFAMGTANTITIPEKYADVAEDIRSFIMTLHDLVNVFDDRSELSEINRMAGRQDVTVNPNTFRLLVHAERARLKTGGSFHAGLLPAIQIWRKAKETQRLPSHFELRKTSHIIKKSELILNPEKHTVFLKKTGQGINLGGIAKGYAIDCTVEVLRKRNVPES